MSQKSLIHIVDDTAENNLAIPPFNGDVLVLQESDIQLETDNDALQDIETSFPETGDIKEHEGANCIAFMGAVGGAGVTSLCIQMAYDLARDTQKKSAKTSRSKEPRICIIDLDLESGACAHQLDLIPGASAQDLTTAADRIDRAFVSSLMTTHSSGLDLFAVPNILGGNDMANAQTVTTILDVVCQMYDHVLLDVPRFWRPWNMAAIAGADRFALVSDLTIPSLHLTRMRMDAIEALLEQPGKCEIVLNKYERRSFRNALREKDAQTALKRDIAATICLDIETSREAINCGEPVGAIRSESRYAKDVKSLLNKWNMTSAATQKQAA